MNIHDKKTAILAELKVAGTTVKDLADKYQVSPMTIGSWRRKEREELAKVDSHKLADIPKAVVAEVVEEMKDKARVDLSPKQFKKIELDLNKIGQSVNGLREMDEAFKTTLLNLLHWANMKIDEDMKISEWTALVKGVADMHKALFSNESNVVNIVNNQQNNAAEQDAFKSGFRS